MIEALPLEGVALLSAASLGRMVLIGAAAQTVGQQVRGMIESVGDATYSACMSYSDDDLPPVRRRRESVLIQPRLHPTTNLFENGVCDIAAGTTELLVSSVIGATNVVGMLTAIPLTGVELLSASSLARLMMISATGKTLGGTTQYR